MSVNFAELQDEIVADLTIELRGDADFDADFLKLKVKDAIKEFIILRKYENTSYKEKQILDDLDRHSSTIKKIAIFDYNQKGAEGQTSHNEGGTNRVWQDRNKIIGNISAFVGVLS